MRDATTSAAAPSTRDATVKRRREFAAEMRAKGYKRVMRWVPDPENPTFAEQRKRDLQALAEHPAPIQTSSSSEHSWHLTHPLQ